MTGGKEFGCISPGVADLLREMIGFTAQERAARFIAEKCRTLFRAPLYGVTATITSVALNRR